MKEKENKQERENFEFWQWHNRNSCCPNLLIEKPIVAMPLPKQGKKKFMTIVAMSLPKIGGKKNSGCRNHM